MAGRRILAVIALAASVVGCGATTSVPPTIISKATRPLPIPTQTKRAPIVTALPTLDPAISTVADQLAYIQDGSGSGSPLSLRFAAQFTVLKRHCPHNSPERLGEFLSNVHDVMKRSRISESYLSILTHVAKSIPHDLLLKDCSEGFAAYATLRGAHG
jgi:hypothetical protein